MTRIEICLGSSCFARGGADYPAVVAAWLAEHGRQAELSGRRCTKACADGPTVLMDGQAHRVPDKQALLQLLESTVQVHA